MTTTTRHATTSASNWRNDAACARVDNDLFFPIGGSRESRDQADQAKRVCAGCPSRESCLQWALETQQDFGVWGGLTEEERYRLHQRRGAWARRRDVAETLYATRRDEFEELVARELVPAQIAEAMDTNVQTVNRLLGRLAADATAVEAVKAA